MSTDHGPDCYACTDPAGAAQQIAAERAELNAWAERGRQRRAEGERARKASLKLLVGGDRDGADHEEALMLHELRAANAIACDVRFVRAHLNRVEAAHPAVRNHLEATA
jgi:hypothetical protein